MRAALAIGHVRHTPVVSNAPAQSRSRADNTQARATVRGDSWNAARGSAVCDALPFASQLGIGRGTLTSEAYHSGVVACRVYAYRVPPPPTPSPPSSAAVRLPPPPRAPLPPVRPCRPPDHRTGIAFQQGARAVGGSRPILGMHSRAGPRAESRPRHPSCRACRSCQRRAPSARSNAAGGHTAATPQSRAPRHRGSPHRAGLVAVCRIGSA